MIPSGYKTSKVYSALPTSGDGDLTFTRSNDTATRVGPDGLIEKVRTNLILQSEAFNTTWSAASLSVTANTTANPLNGALTADTFTLTGATIQKYISQPIVFNGSATISVYLKAGTHQFVQLLLGSDAGSYANFDLTNGTASAIGSTATIVSAGSGFFRCSMSFTSTTGTDVIILAANSLADGRFVTTSSTGTLIAFGCQVETTDFGATDYIATTTAAVSVGPVANVPRLDYLDSSSPRLLLEPQRTNLVTFSEQMDNAAWTKTNVTITANDEVSPDGYTNADKITDNANNNQHRVSQVISVTSGTSYTASIFVKNDDKGDFAINFTASGFSSTKIVFNLINGTVTSGTGTIQDYGNGWYRISATEVADATGNGIVGFNLGDGGVYVGSEQSVFIYGAQIEEGAYATSYIPTLGAAVTRGADAASKTICFGFDWSR